MNFCTEFSKVQVFICEDKLLRINCEDSYVYKKIYHSMEIDCLDCISCECDLPRNRKINPQNELLIALQQEKRSTYPTNTPSGFHVEMTFQHGIHVVYLQGSTKEMMMKADKFS